MLWLQEAERNVVAVSQKRRICGCVRRDVWANRGMLWGFEVGAAKGSGRVDCGCGGSIPVEGKFPCFCLLVHRAFAEPLLQVIIVSIPTSQPSWFSQMFDDDASTRVERRALEYQSTPIVEEHEPYSDREPSEDEIRDEVNEGTRRAIEDIRARKQNGKGAVQPSGLIADGNEWSRE